MSLYKSFPTTTFGQYTIRDISSKVMSKFIENYNLTSCLFDYQIDAIGELPENIAYDFYGSCEYVWIVYLCNNIVDPFMDWYKNDVEFTDYIYAKYGDESAFGATKYYMVTSTDSAGVPYGTKFITPSAFSKFANVKYKAVSYYEDEYTQNQNKRNIKLLKTDLVNRLENSVSNLIGTW